MVNRQEEIGKNVLVVGLGMSGIAAAQWLVRQGFQVRISELKKNPDVAEDVLYDLSQSGTKIELGGHRTRSFLDSDLIVVSPGVSLDIEPLVQAEKKGIPIIGEIELASRYLKTPCIAVTGTNGKSTVVHLIGDMLRRGEKRTFVGGNIGRPLTNYIGGEQKADYVVLEVSSFQLDTIITFSPLIALILNVRHDHLDRYKNFTSYARSKERIFANQGPGQILILNDDDAWLKTLQPMNGLTVYRYGLKSNAERYAALENGYIAAGMPGKEVVRFSLNRFTLPGSHNRENLMAAILTSLALEIPPSAVQETINHFQGLAHRIEFVDTVNGIDFYNDSKATNIDATIRSVASFSKPIILIAGGRDKDGDYQLLVEAIGGNIKCAVFLGEASGLLSEAFGDKISWNIATNMRDAVSRAFHDAQQGDVVLLAPACASFDMFKDFEHRGMVFKEAVRSLKHGFSKKGLL